MTIREHLRYVIDGDASGLLAATKRAAAGLDRMQASMDATGRRMQAVGRTATMGLTVPIVAGLGLAVKAAADEERSMARLAGQMRRSAGATREQIDATERQVTALQNATGIADDKLRPALGRLVTATGDQTRAFGLLRTAADVAAGTGKDVETVATAMARAAQGNTGALGRLGIATKNAAGETKSYAEIVADLDRKYGGLAEKLGKTASGQLEVARRKFEDATESLGSALLPVLADAATAVSHVADAFTGLPDGVQDTAVKVGLLAAAVGPASWALGGLTRLGGGAVGVFRTLSGSSLAAANATAAVGTKADLAAAGLARMQVAAGGVGLAVGAVIARFAGWGTVNDATTEMASGEGGLKSFATTLWGMVDPSVMVQRAIHSAGAEAMDLAEVAQGVFSAATERAATAMGTAAGAADAEKAALTDMTLQAAEAKAQTDALKSATDELLTPFLAAEQASVAYEQALFGLDDAYARVMDDGRVTAQEHTTLRGSVTQMVSAWQSDYTAMMQAGAGADVLAAKKAGVVGKLQELAAKTNGPVRDAILRHIDVVNRIPARANTTVTADTADATAKLSALGQKMRDTFAKFGVPEPLIHAMFGKAATGAVIGGGHGPFTVDRPAVLVGEGSRVHPEYVIPTDPAHRGRAVELAQMLAGDLGLTGLAGGGILTIPGAALTASRALSRHVAGQADQIAVRVGRMGPGTRAASYALAQVGKPYVWGATGPGAFDCSGLTSAAWRAAGVGIPRTSHAQIAAAASISRAAALGTPGALAFKTSAGSPSGGHIFLMTGDGGAVNAKGRAYGVVRDMPAGGAQQYGIPRFHGGGVMPREGLAWLDRAETVVPSRAPVHVTVNVHGSVIAERDLVDAVADGLARRQRYGYT